MVIGSSSRSRREQGSVLGYLLFIIASVGILAAAGVGIYKTFDEFVRKPRAEQLKAEYVLLDAYDDFVKVELPRRMEASQIPLPLRRMVVESELNTTGLPHDDRVAIAVAKLGRCIEVPSLRPPWWSFEQVSAVREALAKVAPHVRSRLATLPTSWMDLHMKRMSEMTSEISAEERIRKEVTRRGPKR